MESNIEVSDAARSHNTAISETERHSQIILIRLPFNAEAFYYRTVSHANELRKHSVVPCHLEYCLRGSCAQDRHTHFELYRVLDVKAGANLYGVQVACRFDGQFHRICGRFPGGIGVFARSGLGDVDRGGAEGACPEYER
jgi:hypothetical protein